MNTWPPPGRSWVTDELIATEPITQGKGGGRNGHSPFGLSKHGKKMFTYASSLVFLVNGGGPPKAYCN